jgi:type II secretory pathway pseudopilin PulG
MKRRVRGPRLGFTLVDLAAAVVILAILIALLLPAVQRVRPGGGSIQSQNNLKQIGIALNNYAGANNNLFPNVAPGNAPFFFCGQTGGTATRAGQPSPGPAFQNGLLSFMDGNVRSLEAPPDPNLPKVSIAPTACSYSIPAYWTTMTTTGYVSLPGSFPRGTAQCIGAAEMTTQGRTYDNIAPFALQPFTPAVANTPSATANNFDYIGCYVIMVDGSCRKVGHAANDNGDFVLAHQPDNLTAFSPKW